MAKPREARGWFVYSIGVALAFLMLAFRLYYATTNQQSPYLLLSWIGLPLMIAVLAGAVAAVGLQQALWYRLVRPGGWALYATSVLMYTTATLFFYALPAHLASRSFFYLMFLGALVLYLYTPALSYGSRTFTGIAVAGSAGLLASSFYGPMTGSAQFENPLVLATLAAEGLLVLGCLRLLLLAVKSPRAAPA
jgi:hypothetical protein